MSDLLFEDTITHALIASVMNGTQITVNRQISTINVAGDWHLIT